MPAFLLAGLVPSILVFGAAKGWWGQREEVYGPNLPPGYGEVPPANGSQQPTPALPGIGGLVAGVPVVLLLAGAAGAAYLVVMARR